MDVTYATRTTTIPHDNHDLLKGAFATHCQDLKKVPQPSGGVSWLEAPRPTGVPAVPMLGASTMGHTSQESPSVDVLPPEEGAVLADVVSVGRVGSLSEYRRIT